MEEELCTSILNDVDPEKLYTHVIVVVYSRNLAYKVTKKLECASNRKVHCIACVCDQEFDENQFAFLNHEYHHIAIGTLGRLTSLLNSRTIDGDRIVSLYIMDAGAMITNNLKEEFCALISELKSRPKLGIHWPPHERLLNAIRTFFRETIVFQPIPKELSDSIHYAMYVAPAANKASVFCELCRLCFGTYVIGFFSDHRTINAIADLLRATGLSLVTLTSLMTLEEKMRAFEAFSSGTVRTMLMTGYFRGCIDLSQPMTIINYEVPYPGTYVRRVNYMSEFPAFAKNTLYITLANYDERGKIAGLQDKLRIPLIHETYALDIA